MIQINNISKSFGTKCLFKDVSFSLERRERVGLVGRNGSGKSTLFNILQGIEHPDGGEILIPKGHRIGTISQHISFKKNTLLEECTQVLQGDYEFDSYKAEKILTGLGLKDFEKNPHSFSGGYQMRINLCKALLNEPDLLLLDEPTNYLDITSIRWFKNFLKSFPGEMIIITHDRDFMDNVTTHTMGLTRRLLKKVKGNTKKYYAQVREEEGLYEKTRINQEKKKREMVRNIERFRAKASRASQAQSKIKSLNRMEEMEKLEDEASFDFSFHYRECPAKTLLSVESLSFGYDVPLFKNLKFSIGKTDRIGVIGKNGKGKSTLLNVLAGELRGATGEIKMHPGVYIGHFGQTNVDRLHGPALKKCTLK